MSLFYSARHDRCHLNTSVEYVLDPFSSEEVYEGVIENISESGMCLIVSHQLQEGQEITIRTLMFLPSQTAAVCWIEPHDDLYRAGLKFI